MKNGRIWLSSPTMHGDERKYIDEAFASNWVAPLGPHVDAFERELAAYAGLRAGAALASGTAALHLALKLAGVRPGDKVFCSDLTFAATVNPVSYEGAEQVFIDAERESWNMDPRALEKAFDRYPSCRCVVLAHLYGSPAKLDEITDICAAHGALLIEDAAESLSATYKGRQTGSFGAFGIFSFNGNKIITTSGGGALVSDDEEAIEKARFYSTQAREPFPWYEHVEIGYNYRMSNLLAGLGRAQMLHLAEHREAKARIYETYKAAFTKLDGISMNPFLPCSRPNHWLSCISLDASVYSVKPTDLVAALAQINAEARPIWKPMHLQPVFAGRDFVSVEGDVGRDIFERGLCLPSDIKMSPAEQELVIETLKKALL